MARAQDPTDAMRRKAGALPDATQGTSCNQSSFKVGKGSFFFLGPGAKGQGYKAMFKLERSLPQAEERAARQPESYEVGSTGWVTTRFTAEKPLPKSIWEKWLKESYEIACGAGSRRKKKATKKKSSRKR